MAQAVKGLFLTLTPFWTFSPYFSILHTFRWLLLCVASIFWGRRHVWMRYEEGLETRIAIALVVCSFIAMGLICFDMLRWIWKAWVAHDGWQYGWRSSDALSFFKGKTEMLEGTSGFSTAGRDVKGESITWQEGQFSWSEHLRILCGCLLVYVSVSSCDLRGCLSTWSTWLVLLQSLSHLTALGSDNLASRAVAPVIPRSQDGAMLQASKG